MANPIVPWIGGKRKLADQIIPLFRDHQCYIEPFCGAGAIFFLKPPSPAEVINDINGELVNLYRVVKHHLEELHRQFKWALCSRQNWEWLQMTEVATLTDVQRSARFLYLQKMAFGGRVDKQSFGTSTTSRPRFNLLTLEHDLTEAHYRLSQATIENKNWLEICDKYDRSHSLFYLDPPYWETEGYGVDFQWSEYQAIEAFMRRSTGTVILSINDHPAVRELFKDYPLEAIKYSYTVGGSDNAKECVELIIGNWKDGFPTRKWEQASFAMQ